MGLPKGKWGVAYTCEVPMIKRGVVDYAVGADWTPASGDVKLDKDDAGSAASITTLPTAVTMGNGATWKFSLSASEMQATNKVTVTVVDAATKAVEDQQFIIDIDYGIRSNTAQTGGNTTITLDSSASAVDDFYRGELIEIIGGTGVGQFRRIASYVGSTKVATVNRAWATNPDSTSIFRICTPAFGEVDTTHVGGTSQTAGDLKTILDTLTTYVDTEVAAIKAKTDNLPSDPADASDIVSSFGSISSTLTTIATYIDTEVASILSTVNSGTHGNAALLTAIQEISGGGSSGSFTVPVHVSDDSTNDVVGKIVTVRLSGVLQTLSAATDADGNTTVSLNAGDNYEFIVPAGNGFTGSTTSVDVTDATPVELVVTAVSTTVSPPGYTTCIALIHELADANAQTDGIAAYLEILKIPPETTGLIIPDPLIKAEPDVSGNVEFAGIPYGSECRVRAGFDGDTVKRWFSFTAGSGATTNIATVMGRSVE